MSGPSQKPGQPSGSRPPTSSGDMSAGAGPEGSKFKRFLKRFGRRTSDDANPSSSIGNGNATSNGGHEQPEMPNGRDGVRSPDRARTESMPAANGNEDGSKKNSIGKQSKRAGSKTAKRSDSLLSGRFFQSTPNSPAMSATKQGDLSAKANGSSIAGVATPKPKSDARFAPAESGQARVPIASGRALNTAASRPATSHNEPAAAKDAPHADGQATGLGLTDKGADTTHAVSTDAAPGVLASAMGVTNVIAPVKDESQQPLSSAQQSAESPRNSFLSHQSGHMVSSDNDSHLRRNSIDNATVNTTKSRASTKPTTLMSLDTRDNFQGSTYAPIAQFTSGTDGGHRTTGSRVSDAGSSGMQFLAPLARSASGSVAAMPGQSDPTQETPYTNVPSTTRPHPSNNPHPSNIPADNASMLTLASSNAAASILGGAASSRGHSHAAPSMGGGGGARSIGGSYLGERRNSSDTYASVKALPPLSRRGSDSSQRTSRSIAASATGQNSHQAMTHGGSSFIATTGPGAPPDRISIHRTASQRTIATQLSIPLSTSNQVVGASGQATVSSGDDIMTTTHSSNHGMRRASGNGLVGSSEASLHAAAASQDANGGVVNGLEPAPLVPSKDSIPATA